MSDRPPKDYADQDQDQVDFEDAWDPTGYYRRKAERNAEMLPYLVALYLLALAIVAGVYFYSLRENVMTGYIIVGVACLFIGWNTPQPLYAQKAENWVRAKLGLQTKTLRQ